MILKTVTLQEANGLLPMVREHFFRIQVFLGQLQKLRAKISKKTQKDYVFDAKSDVIAVVKKKNRFRKTRNKTKQLESLIEKEIGDLMRLGVIIKGIVPPHIDFLSMRNYELIYLCWHGGEGEIEHWHHVDDGSPFRHSIEQKSCFGPHMVH